MRMPKANRERVTCPRCHGLGTLQGGGFCDCPHATAARRPSLRADPPPGYSQFLVERWAHVVGGTPPPTPCVVWVKTIPVSLNDIVNDCQETMGYLLSVDSAEELEIYGHGEGRWPALCACNGRIIE